MTKKALVQGLFQGVEKVNFIFRPKVDPGLFHFLGRFNQPISKCPNLFFELSKKKYYFV
jgi:hypothetical protein